MGRAIDHEAHNPSLDAPRRSLAARYAKFDRKLTDIWLAYLRQSEPQALCADVFPAVPVKTTWFRFEKERPMSERTQGMVPKYSVRRLDGSDAAGGKHEGCEYWALDLSHDPHAIPALAAYIVSCRADGWEALAKDLERRYGLAIAWWQKSIEKEAGNRTMLANRRALDQSLRSLAAAVGIEEAKVYPNGELDAQYLISIATDALAKARGELVALKQAKQATRVRHVAALARFDRSNRAELKRNRKTRRS